MRKRHLAIAALATLGLAGCAAAGVVDAEEDTVVSVDPEAEEVSEVPRALSDFERICSDKLGFPGLQEYQPSGKGVHPAALLTRYKDGWMESSAIGQSDFPKGWIVGYQDDVRSTELVLCFDDHTSDSEAGKVCQMEDTKTKEKYDVTMYNTTWELRVLSARSGEVLYTRKGRAASTQCPVFRMIGSDEDRGKYYTEAGVKDIRKYVKRFIAV